MLQNPISITALATISALGNEPEAIWSAYLDDKSYFNTQEFNGKKMMVASLPNSVKTEIEALRKSDTKYMQLDDSVLFAIYTARKALVQSGWEKGSEFGVNLGSSRGATQLFEKYHQEFLEEGRTSTLTSPTTTLGNISSWVAHDLNAQGPNISHSITCSTALHAVLNAVAWIQGGLAERFMVGGSEAPLTPFTIAQMQALKIYSRMSLRAESRSHSKGDFPCRSLDLKKKQNTMILGEGAGVACLEKGKIPNALAQIIGMGYATEPLEHNVSISTDAKCFQDSMRMALGKIKPEEIDAIVMHAPGTVKGDLSEYNAIKSIFGDKHPFLTTNKWKLGHTFGASGILSLEMAILMLRKQEGILVPFFENQKRKAFQKILVNAVGFGGNAVSILLQRNNS